MFPSPPSPLPEAGRGEQEIPANDRKILAWEAQATIEVENFDDRTREFLDAKRFGSQRQFTSF